MAALDLLLGASPLTRRSVALNVALLLVTVITLVLSVAGFVALRVETARARAALRAQADASADHLASLRVLPVWNIDHRQIGRIVESAMADRDIAGIARGHPHVSSGRA